MRQRITCSQQVQGIFAEENVALDAGEYDVTDLAAASGKAVATLNVLYTRLYMISSRAEIGKSAIISAEAFEELKAKKLITVCETA